MFWRTVIIGIVLTVGGLHGCNVYSVCITGGGGCYCDLKTMNTTGCVNDHADHCHSPGSLYFMTDANTPWISSQFDLYVLTTLLNNAVYFNQVMIGFYQLTYIELDLPPNNSFALLNNYVVAFTFWSMRFSLRVKGEPITMSNCERIMTTTNASSLLTSVFTTQLEFDFAIFPEKICPLIFKDMNLNQLVLTNTMFEFDTSLDHRNDLMSRLNSKIQVITFNEISNLRLTRKTLHPQVFANIVQLEIASTALIEIEIDLFASFPQISVIYMGLYNIKGFLHKQVNQLEWVNYINHDLVNATLKPQDYFRLVFVEFEAKTTSNTSIFDKTGPDDFGRLTPDNLYDSTYFPHMAYQFPDEDFCIFESFPFDNVVQAIIVGDLKDCSCTIIWLYQKLLFYIEIGVVDAQQFKSIKSCDTLDPNKLNDTLQKCNFDQKSSDCDVQETDRLKSNFYQSDPYFSYYDMSRILDQTKVILIKNIGPLVSFLGVVFNLLIVIPLLYNYKRKKTIQIKTLNKHNEIVLLKEPLYKYMLASGLINFVYCLIYLFDLTVPCIATQTYYLYMLLEKDECFKKDTIVSVTSSILKLVSNFALLQMSICRYVLIGKDHMSFLKTLSTIKFRTFTIITLVVSSGLSVVVYYEEYLFASFYGETRNLLIPDDNPYHQYLWNNIKNFHMLSWARWGIELELPYLPTLFGFVVFHDLFSYFLYCLLSAFLDIITIKKLREVLDDKAKAKNERNEKSRDAERKSIIMIVLNSLSNFVFRSPELVGVVAFYIFSFKSHNSFRMLCHGFHECLAFVDLANIFYLMSISNNFFFYYKFNANFKQSFQKLFPFIFKDKSISQDPPADQENNN